MKDARERRGETKVRANLKSFRPLLPGSHPDLPIFFFFFFLLLSRNVLSR